MADVAMSPVLSTPTKFLFPRDAAVAAAAESSSFDFSLLGLGDVLIPGLLIGLLMPPEPPAYNILIYFAAYFLLARLRRCISLRSLEARYVTTESSSPH